MKRLFRPETAFFLVVWLFVLIAFRERGFYDPGSLWHIKVGELILGHGFPQTDPFTYTFEGRTWIPQQWGAEVLMALAHRVGGFDTMLLAFASLVAMLFTVIFSRATRNGMGPLLAVLVVGAALFVGAFHYYVRPHMVTIALLGWTMMCVIDFERGRCGTARLAWLIPLYVVWTNLHGGVLGGTMTLGLAVAGWTGLFLLNRLRSGREFSRVGANIASPVRNWRTAVLLVAVVAACGLTPFVNPFGMELLNTWQRIVGSKVLPEVIVEHMPLDPVSPLGLTVLGFGALYLFLLAGTYPRVPHASWLVPVVWLALSFKGIRQGPLFAITAVVAAVDLWPHTVWYRLLKRYGDGSLAPEPVPVGSQADGRPWWVVIPTVAMVVALGLQINRTPVPVVGHGWARLDPDFIPVELTEQMTAYAASVPPGTRIFNDANLGGYLIYHTPSLKIFMDDRCELYGDEWMREYTDALGKPPDEVGAEFEVWAERYHFERALVGTVPGETPTLEQYLLDSPARWREVGRGRRAVLFERVRR